VSDYREKLMRECFELERDFNYWEFRQHHWHHPEIVATCPLPEEREEALRGFWNQDAEKRFPEYQQAVAGLSLEELEAEKEQWLDRLSVLSVQEYQEILGEASLPTPANDNSRGIDLWRAREQLVRRHFEAYRDLTWFEELEPKFREQGIDGKQLQSFREAWNERAEIRDWEWWRKETALKPSERLEDEIMDITDRLDQLGSLRWLEEKKGREQHAVQDYQRILADAARLTPANDNSRGIDL